MKKHLALAMMMLAINLIGYAQFDMIKKKLIDKGKKAAKDTFTENIDQSRDKLDSTDFNYAISVIDNSGMMNIQSDGEAATKTAEFLSNRFVKNQSQITPAQRSRATLDSAEKAYSLRLYRIAEFYFLRAKQSYEKHSLTTNINYSKVLADLGLLYATMGRPGLANQYTNDALQRREQTLGKNSKAYASSLNNIAVLNQDMGRYNEAEQNFNDALTTVKQVLGDQSQEYAIVLNNQSIFFSKVGRYEQAIEKLKTAIGVLQAKGNADSRNTVGFQSNLALLYQKTGKLAEAETIYLKLERDLKIQPKNPYYAGVLDNLALLYIQMGKTDKVEGYFKQSADVYRTRFGNQNPNYAKVLNDLGNFYRMEGRFADAEARLSESMTIRAAILDATHPDFVKSEEDLGILYWKKGDHAKALASLQSAMDKSLDFVNRFFPPMSEAEKTKYWDVLQPRFQRFFNYCLDASASNPDIAKEMFNYQIATKALLLNSTNRIKQVIFSSGDVSLIADYTSWLDKKESLARYYSLSKQELQDQKIDLASLEQEANQLERSLSQRSSDFSSGYTAEKIGVEKIAGLLTDTEALVELIRIQTFAKDFTNESKYAALVLTRNTTPKLAILDNGGQLETRYAKFYKNAIQQKIADGYSYDQYWARIDGLIGSKKTIYVSPDGVYNQLNLNTLKKPTGDYLINRYDFILVGNSRDLITLKATLSNTKKEAFLLGFPDYGGATIAALPGTKVEVEGISRTLKTAGYQVSLSEQGDATESKLKSIKGTSLIHIATHGYFLEDATDAVGVHADNAKNNPLLRSGLLLAGASKTMSGEVLPNLESNDNGILTAYEAMNLNLTGTSLLVLSACETGLGEIRTGEGVYGLQRAFIVAGAKTLVMSLWKVDDAATQALMTQFYTNLSKGLPKVKAFKQAQLQLILKYKEPYYWGAFVMIGQ